MPQRRQGDSPTTKPTLPTWHWRQGRIARAPCAVGTPRMVIGVRVETGIGSQPHGEVVTLDGVIASEVIFGARSRREPPRVNSVVLTTRRRATQRNHVERTRYPSGDGPKPAGRSPVDGCAFQNQVNQRTERPVSPLVLCLLWNRQPGDMTARERVVDGRIPTDAGWFRRISRCRPSERTRTS